MYIITKDFHFSASHQLTGLPETHPCARVHGHNYVLRVSLASKQLDSVGFVKDYRELDPIKTWVDDTLDHRHLNDVFDFNPTSENIARYIHQYMQECGIEVHAVAISETPKTWATYNPNI